MHGHRWAKKCNILLAHEMKWFMEDCYDAIMSLIELPGSLICNGMGYTQLNSLEGKGH